MRGNNILKRLTSTVLITAVALAFSITIGADDSYAASGGKTYYLPTNVYMEETGVSKDEVTFDELSVDKIKYDKYGNVTSLYFGGIPYKFKIKYKNKKGLIKSVTAKTEGKTIKKTYDKKGRLKTVKTPKATYKYQLGKKNTIKKVTKKGKTFYNVKSIKFHKNGFAKKVVYSNGNYITYNKNGLAVTYYSKSEKLKCKYKYTYSKGMLTEAKEYHNGKLRVLYHFDYNNYEEGPAKPAKTKSVWQYSSVMCFLSAPSAAGELYPKSALSGVNNINY